MDEYLKANLARWNELVSIHAKSTFYDVAAFRAGKSTLKSLELEEVGDVAGKSLLHLQCHFGLDTLSWARLGAKVMGVDFSDRAIALARSLAVDQGLPASFVCANIYDLPDALTGEFDVVFTSYGVLCWLPDIAGWARVVAHFLKPGGTFYVADGHPTADVFYNEPDATELKPHYPYFPQSEPSSWEDEVSYVDGDYKLVNRRTYEWSHSLGEIVNALISAGLRIQFLHEFPFCFFKRFPFMEQDAEGRWWLKEGNGLIPLVFSIRATKD